MDCEIIIVQHSSHGRPTLSRKLFQGGTLHWLMYPTLSMARIAFSQGTDCNSTAVLQDSCAKIEKITGVVFLDAPSFTYVGVSMNGFDLVIRYLTNWLNLKEY